MEGRCAFCKKLNPTNVCERCKNTAYCNRYCQTKDWPTHQVRCWKSIDISRRRRDGRKEKKKRYTFDIKSATLQNQEFGPKIIFNDPSNHIQLGLMSVLPGKNVPKEKHPHITQMIEIVQGSGVAIVGDKEEKLEKNTLLIIPENTYHEIINTGIEPLKFYTFYAKDKNKNFAH